MWGWGWVATLILHKASSACSEKMKLDLDNMADKIYEQDPNVTVKSNKAILQV